MKHPGYNIELPEDCLCVAENHPTPSCVFHGEPTALNGALARRVRGLEHDLLKARSEQSPQFDLRQLQVELKPWVDHNFGVRPDWHPLLGVVEEVGELAHSYLKSTQGIRGTAAEHEAAAKDALGDALVYMADFANIRGWDLTDVLEAVWNEVKKRDWQANKELGV